MIISILVCCLIPDPRGPPCLADALLHCSCRRAVAKLAHFLVLGVFNGSIALIQNPPWDLQRKTRLKQAPVARWRDVKSNSAQRAIATCTASVTDNG
ncbi:hypothetical protein DTO212C5_5597 [Paecilomyces variotii]|nr:hypothetical protein DTO212C5_5597 [Paecilomyces variotii]